MSKAAMNLQDSFLNQVRRENAEVNILLVNGKSLRGNVKGFDNFTVILNSRGGQHLIYKHAIAQLVSQRSMNMKREDGSPAEEGDESVPAETAIEATPQQADGAQQKQRHDGFHGHNRPQNQPRRDNREQRDNRPKQQQQQQPKKDGFNTLDLSSVKLGEEQSQPVKVATEEG